jgi:hypothetical protein
LSCGDQGLAQDAIFRGVDQHRYHVRLLEARIGRVVGRHVQTGVSWGAVRPRYLEADQFHMRVEEMAAVAQAVYGPHRRVDVAAVDHPEAVVERASGIGFEL